jgi:hypothetical protein
MRMSHNQNVPRRQGVHPKGGSVPSCAGSEHALRTRQPLQMTRERDQQPVQGRMARLRLRLDPHHSAGGDRLDSWPADMRILIRRGNPHPGAQLTLFEQHEGKRYQVTATNTPAARSSSSRSATEPRPGSKTGSAARKAPAWDICRPGTTRSTPPGGRPPPSPATCWLGCGSSPSTATWQRPSPRPALQDPPHSRADRQRPAPPAPEDPAIMALGTSHR